MSAEQKKKISASSGKVPLGYRRSYNMQTERFSRLDSCPVRMGMEMGMREGQTCGSYLSENLASSASGSGGWFSGLLSLRKKARSRQEALLDGPGLKLGLRSLPSPHPCPLGCLWPVLEVP